MKKTLDTVITIILVIVLVFMAVVSLNMIISSVHNDIPSVFGYSPITIYDTKSMEPTFGADDLVIVKKTDATALEVGDIISFWGIVDNSRNIITHRIVEVVTLDDGTCAYRTKGDNNDLMDQSEFNDFRQPDIMPHDVIGEHAFTIKGVGKVLTFIKSPTGILVCMVLPIGLIFIWQLVKVLRMFFAMKLEKQSKANAELNEAEKQRVIEEYLRSQQEAAALVAEETPAESVEADQT